MQLRGPVHLTGAVYAASAPLVVFPSLRRRPDRLPAGRRPPHALNLDTLQVNYNPSLPIFGVGVPVLIRLRSLRRRYVSGS